MSDDEKRVLCPLFGTPDCGEGYSSEKVCPDGFDAECTVPADANPDGGGGDDGASDLRAAMDKHHADAEVMDLATNLLVSHGKLLDKYTQSKRDNAALRSELATAKADYKALQKAKADDVSKLLEVGVKLKETKEYLEAAQRGRNSALAEIEQWKDACGLECGGDPDGVTPAAMQKYWEGVEQQLATANERVRELEGERELIMELQSQLTEYGNELEARVEKLERVLRCAVPLVELWKDRAAHGGDMMSPDARALCAAVEKADGVKR